LPPLSLHGVLRSEAEEHIAKELATYLRNPQVRATSLMRIAMFGAVGAPGFYHFSPNLTLSDAIMNAGGPSATADFGRSSIKRANDRLYNGKQVEQAITEGTTLDRMNLHGGDMIEVGTPRSLLASGMRALLTAGAIAASIIALRGL
jgi:protein involved in polysaccharide export with SLBB domain